MDKVSSQEAVRLRAVNSNTSSSTHKQIDIDDNDDENRPLNPHEDDQVDIDNDMLALTSSSSTVSTSSTFHPFHSTLALPPSLTSRFCPSRRTTAIFFIILIILYITFRILFDLIDAGYFDDDVSNSMMVIYATQDFAFNIVLAQGCMSDFFSVIGALMYAVKHNAAGVKVIFHSKYYSDVNVKEGRMDENYFNYFYEPNPMIINENIKHPKEIHFNRYFARFGKWGTFTRYIRNSAASGNVHTTFPITSAFTRVEMNYYLSKHLRPKQYVIDSVDKFASAHNLPISSSSSFSSSFSSSPSSSSPFIIGVHYRGSDKITQYPFVSPNYSVYPFLIEKVIEKYIKNNHSQRKIIYYIATDEIQFIEYMSKKYGENNVVYISAPRADVHDKRGLHKTPGISNFEKGLTALQDVLLLSRCNYIIKNRSSVSDIPLIWNPHVNFTMIMGREDPCFSSDNMECPPKSVWDSKVSVNDGDNDNDKGSHHDTSHPHKKS